MKCIYLAVLIVAIATSFIAVTNAAPQIVSEAPPPPPPVQAGPQPSSPAQPPPQDPQDPLIVSLCSDKTFPTMIDSDSYGIICPQSQSQ